MHLSLSRHGDTAMDDQLDRGVRRGRDYTDQMLTIVQMSPLHAQYVTSCYKRAGQKYLGWSKYRSQQMM